MKGRRITYNVLLAHELAHNYHRAGMSCRSAIKIDLMKAYNSVDWNYMCNTMRVASFPDQFVKWVAARIKNPCSLYLLMYH